MELNKAISLAKKGNTLAQRHLYEQYKVRLRMQKIFYKKDLYKFSRIYTSLKARGILAVGCDK